MRNLVAFLAISLTTTACSGGPNDGRGNTLAQADVTSTTPFDTVDPGNTAVKNAAGEANRASSASALTDRDAWVGRWIGVEGLNLTVTKSTAAGRYSLKMQYGTDAGTSGTFEGIGTAEGIAFTRPDGDQVLQASTGEETGLKYLAGMNDCLKVKDGEGYCRK